MNTALWVVQIVLAALYVMAGVSKVTGQGPMLEQMMRGFSLALIRLVGLGEALAGLALVLPAGRAQLGGSRGLGWGNPGGRGGCVSGLPPLASGLYARRRHVDHGPPGRFRGLGKVEMKEFQALPELSSVSRRPNSVRPPRA
jgi:hypothetical protein